MASVDLIKQAYPWIFVFSILLTVGWYIYWLAKQNWELTHWESAQRNRKGNIWEAICPKCNTVWHIGRPMMGYCSKCGEVIKNIHKLGRN